MHNLLRAIREEKGYSQQQIAQILEIKQQHYSRYEKGQHEMPMHHYIKLADFYGVSLDFLVGRDEQRNGQDGSETNAG